MLRKQVDDNSQHWVEVIDSRGPASSVLSACPQIGCQEFDGARPRSKGRVLVEEFGSETGDCVISFSCLCCNGKGVLPAGEKPYQAYCFKWAVRDLVTPYPSPHPMSSELFNDSRLIAAMAERHARNMSARPNRAGGRIDLPPPRPPQSRESQPQSTHRGADSTQDDSGQAAPRDQGSPVKAWLHQLMTWFSGR